MRNRIKFITAAFLILLAAVPLFARDIFGERDSLFSRPPEPHLISPIYEEAYATGDSLEFKWWHASIGIDRYEFKLYKGSDMYSSNLILEKVLPYNESFVKVEANLFEENQEYTWSLRQVADSGTKSDKSFITFRIVKQKSK